MGTAAAAAAAAAGRGQKIFIKSQIAADLFRSCGDLLGGYPGSEAPLNLNSLVSISKYFDSNLKS